MEQERKYRSAGVALALAVCAVGFVTSVHWFWFALKALLAVALLLYVARSFARNEVEQRISIVVDGLEGDQVAAQQAATSDALGSFTLASSEPRSPGDPLEMSVQKTDSVGRIIRALRAFSPNTKLLSVRSVLHYTTRR